MSEGIMVVAEHLHGELSETTRQAVAAGKEMKEAGLGPLAVALLAPDPAMLVEAASLDGVNLIVHVPVTANEFDADIYAASVEALVRAHQPAVVLMGFTANSMSMAPAVAARTDSGFASDVVAIAVEAGEVVARRDFYGGKVEAELEFGGHATVVLLLRPNIWAPATASETPEITSFAAGIDRTRMRHREYVAPPADEFDIGKADVILAIGRGIGERENIPRFEELADKMGVTLAASRPLVDAGWMPKSRQVGQSGVTVKPKLYIALGISGAVQHLAGLRGSERIIAVNEDPHAAIFSVAQYGAVEDLFDVVEALETLW